MSGRYCSLLVIHIFRDHVLPLHLIKQETGLDLDARSWALTCSCKVFWLNFGLFFCSLVTVKQLTDLGSEMSYFLLEYFEGFIFLWVILSMFKSTGDIKISFWYTLPDFMSVVEYPGPQNKGQHRERGYHPSSAMKNQLNNIRPTSLSSSPYT